MDGTKLSYRTELAGNAQIWFQDLESGAKRPLTPLSPGIYRDAISVDGSQVAFHEWDHKAGGSLHWMSTSGKASSAMPAQPPLAIWDWTPDGHDLLVMSRVGPVFTAERVDVVTRKAALFLRRPHHVFQTHISHDGRWAIAQELGVGVLITHYDPKHPEQNQWRLLGLPQADLIRWSADDNTIYFLSNADSFSCVWAQRLEPVTKQLRGSPLAVAHFHQARRSLNVQDSGEIGLAVARNKIVLAEAERTGNVWITKLQ
ncbi:MAG: hypothetical protein JO108_09570 [Acidobacteriaceae bacterium]|nr:hypothetical protein [Acidobacteriaceae bacterium]